MRQATVLPSVSGDLLCKMTIVCHRTRIRIKTFAVSSGRPIKPLRYETR